MGTFTVRTEVKFVDEDEYVAVDLEEAMSLAKRSCFDFYSDAIAQAYPTALGVRVVSYDDAEGITQEVDGPVREYDTTKISDTVCLLRVTETAPRGPITETELMESHGWELSPNGKQWVHDEYVTTRAGFVADVKVGVTL